MNKDVQDEISNLEQKYFELVWYARRQPHNLKNEIVKRKSDEVEERWGNEFSFPTNGDWEHGFNSGCLAAFRFVLEAMDKSKFGGLEQARENFPMLDT
jgi:hypothetical protein